MQSTSSYSRIVELELIRIIFFRRTLRVSEHYFLFGAGSPFPYSKYEYILHTRYVVRENSDYQFARMAIRASRRTLNLLITILILFIRLPLLMVVLERIMFGTLIQFYSPVDENKGTFTPSPLSSFVKWGILSQLE